jgi:hypothetical protein
MDLTLVVEGEAILEHYGNIVKINFFTAPTAMTPAQEFCVTARLTQVC